MDRERCPVGHKTQQGPVRFNTINYYPLLTEAQKAFIHSNAFPPMPLLNNLLLRSSCGGVSKACSKSKMKVST